MSDMFFLTLNSLKINSINSKVFNWPDSIDSISIPNFQRTNKFHIHTHTRAHTQTNDTNQMLIDSHPLKSIYIEYIRNSRMEWLYLSFSVQIIALPMVHQKKNSEKQFASCCENNCHNLQIEPINTLISVNLKTHRQFIFRANQLRGSCAKQPK